MLYLGRNIHNLDLTETKVNDVSMLERVHTLELYGINFKLKIK